MRIDIDPALGKSDGGVVGVVLHVEDVSCAGTVSTRVGRVSSVV